jgi:tetratricopeptide (TPR) repeat protein
MLLCRNSASAAEATFVAFSMNAAQRSAEAAIQHGEDFRKSQPELYYLGGITKPWALVFDVTNNDCILVGEDDPQSSEITLDDWAVALRARVTHFSEDPGVTIDPSSLKESMKTGQSNVWSHWSDDATQDVRFFAGIANTHFGKVCFDADWLLKKIAFGKTQIPHGAFPSEFARSVEETRHSSVRRTSTSRLWFFPTINQVNVFPDLVLIERFDIGVMTELLYAEVDGKPIKDFDKYEDKPTEAFCKDFNEHYDEMADNHEVLKTLKGLARLAALAKGLVSVGKETNVDFYLSKYSILPEQTPTQTNVLNVVDNEVGARMQGGVTLHALAVRMNSGDATALRDIVFAARHAVRSNSLAWKFQLELDNGRLANVKIPPQFQNLEKQPYLLAQARFREMRGQYQSAIDWYSQFLQVNETNANAYNHRGWALSNVGEHDRAISDFEKVIHFDKRNPVAYYNLGVEYGKYETNYDEAMRAYTKALNCDSYYYEAWCARSQAWDKLGNIQRASDDIDTAISIDPTSFQAFWLRGYQDVEVNQLDRAISDFSRAATNTTDNTYRADSFVKRGYCYLNKDDLASALSDFNTAIAIDPGMGSAYFNKAVIQARNGDIRAAVASYRKFLKKAKADDGDLADKARQKIEELEIKSISTNQSVWYAVVNRNAEKVQQLIKQGQDVDESRGGGFTALMLACQEEYTAIVSLLLAAGADANAVDSKGVTPLYMAAENENETIVADLLKHGARTDVTTIYGYSPLIVACHQGNRLVVQLLVNGGADPSLRMKDGSTPLGVAIEQGHREVADYLRDVLRNRGLK